MANVVSYEFGASNAAGFGWLERVRKAISDYRLYRRTLEELQSLSDRELADLGVSRLSLTDVARSSVYDA